MEQIMNPCGDSKKGDFVCFPHQIFDVCDPLRPVEMAGWNAFECRQIGRKKAQKAKEIEDKKKMYKNIVAQFESV